MSNDRGLVTRTVVSNSIRKDLAEELNILSKETRIPKSKLLDEAIELLLEKHKGEQQG